MVLVLVLIVCYYLRPPTGIVSDQVATGRYVVAMWSLCGRYALDSGRQGRYGVAMSIIQVAMLSLCARFRLPQVAMWSLNITSQCGRYEHSSDHNVVSEEISILCYTT